MENKTVLNVDNIVMQFGGLRAINGVSSASMKLKSLGLSARTVRAKPPCST